MTETRQQIADVLLTAAVVGVGLVTGNPVIATVVGGIGINWASELTRGGWQAACQKLLGSSGLLNHDLQQALARAFRQALAHLEQAWWETPHAKHVRRAQPDVARETAQVFKMLQTDTEKYCKADGIRRAANNEQVRQLLNSDETTAVRIMDGCLAGYLHGHDDLLIAFLNKHLVQEVAFWFGEELKADRPESNRAWRAFQRLLLEGLQTSLTEVQAGQRDTQRILENLRGDLQAWTDRMDALSADVRERTGEAALLQALTGMRDELLAAIATEADLTRTAIEASVERIALLFSEELARLRGDLLPLLGKRGLVEGQAPLRADLRHHFDALLQDYALFGGRAEELAAIHTFLADPQGGYLFITGPSGYGKTALLVQLALQGETAYHFFSRAYDTAGEDLFLRNLCQQLAARHGLGGQLPVSTAELRALYPDLLRLPPADGQPVVVLIDGLDEAADWEPGPLHFPTDVPDGVKVIFSARQVADQDWLARLRLPRDRIRQLTLGAMTAEDVRFLLLAAGGSATPLANEPGWIAQALRVSAGDPFYLKLLVEDVRDGRMLPDQIETQPEGLDSYLERWYLQVANAATQQNYEYHHDLLGCLSAARGPLGRRDLIEMFPRLNMILAALPAELRRFIVGDKDNGYALCHPRLADYVQSTFARRELQAYRDTLVAYCAGWRDHRSPYALAHYAGHLAEAGRWEELHTLVATGAERQEWAEAHFAAEGSYAGYLADLGLAWAHADKQGVSDPTAVGRQVRYALIESSIHSLASQMPIPVLLAAVTKGVMSPQAVLEYARQLPDASRRANALREFAQTLPASKQGAVLTEALAAARMIQDGPSRFEALISLAPHMHEIRLAEVTAALQQSLYVGSREYVLDDAMKARCEAIRRLAPHMPEPDLAEALEAARTMDDCDRASTLTGLAQRLFGPQRGQIIAEALTAAISCGDDSVWIYHYDVMRPLAPHLTEEGLHQAMTAVLDFDRYSAPYVYAYLAKHLPEAAQSVTVAAVVAEHPEDIGEWSLAFVSEGLKLPESKHDALVSTALAWARTTRNSHGFARVAAHLPESERVTVITEALALARMTEDKELRAEKLSYLVPYLQEPERSAAVSEALAVALPIADENRRIEALTDLVPHLSKKELREVLARLRAINDRSSQARLLALLTPYLPEKEIGTAVSETLAIVRTIQDDERRLGALVNWAAFLSGPEIHELLVALRAIVARESQAVGAEAQTSDIRKRAEFEVKTEMAQIWQANVVTWLAPHLQEPQLGEAWSMAYAIEHEWSRARALAALAPLHSEPGRTLALTEALASARQLRPREQLKVLASLIPHLSEPNRNTVLMEALDLARKSPPEGLKIREHVKRLVPPLERVEGLASLLPQLSEPERNVILAEALSLARSISYGRPRSEGLASLAPWMPASERNVILAKITAEAKEVQDDRYRVQMLAPFAPYLPDMELAWALVAASAFVDASARGELLARLAPGIVSWCQRNRPAAWSSWSTALHTLCIRTRTGLLSDFRALISVIASLGGASGVIESFRAIQDVGRWWP